MVDTRDARTVLRTAGLYPKKSFGQNFLVDPNVVRAIASACVHDDEVGKTMMVELGAGLGALTGLLVERARVIAVERDRDLVPLLSQALSGDIQSGRLRVVEGDAQTFDLREAFATAAPGELRVLGGNLPYQITGRLLERAVVASDTIDRAVFMVQREVADRLLAEPGTKTYGALTVFTRAAFDVSRVRNVSPGSFHPPPDVTSTVVALTPRRPRRAEETPTFRALVKRAFEARRKTLRNAWSSVGEADRIARAAAAAEIALERRGETLSVDEFAKMARRLDEAP